MRVECRISEYFQILCYVLLITVCPSSPLPRIICHLLCFFQSPPPTSPLIKEMYSYKCVLLWAGWSWDGMSAGFSAPVQTCLGAYPASYSVGTGSFLGVNWSGHGIDHPSLSSTKVKERVQLYLYSGPSRPVID